MIPTGRVILSQALRPPQGSSHPAPGKGPHADLDDHGLIGTSLAALGEQGLLRYIFRRFDEKALLGDPFARYRMLAEGQGGEQ